MEFECRNKVYFAVIATLYLSWLVHSKNKKEIKILRVTAEVPVFIGFTSCVSYLNVLS